MLWTKWYDQDFASIFISYFFFHILLQFQSTPNWRNKFKPIVTVG